MEKPSFLEITKHDVFRYGGGLNKSAAQVYYLLINRSLTVKQITSETGRSRRTISRVLSRMQKIIDSRTGEVICMVEQNGRVWTAREVNLDLIALIIGTAGIGRKQLEKHARERRAHNKLFRPIKRNLFFISKNSTKE